MTSCPICGLEPIPPDKTQCPQCDADLACFKVLDSLPDELVARKAGSGRRLILIAIAGLFLVLASILSGFQIYRSKGFESRILDQQTRIMKAIVNLEVKLARFARHQSKPPEASPSRTEGVRKTKEDATTNMDVRSPPPVRKPLKMPEGSSLQQEAPRKTQGKDAGSSVSGDIREKSPKARSLPGKVAFWTYEANEKDSLWHIAKKYYGLGQFYAVLLEHNPHLGIYHIGDGVKIRILKDGRLAKGIYKKVTKREGDRIYWHYTLAKGDTLSSIARRFYKTEDMAKRITDLNPRIRWYPGERIRILLK